MGSILIYSRIIFKGEPGAVIDVSLRHLSAE